MCQESGERLPHSTIDRSADGVSIIGIDFFYPGKPEDGVVTALAGRDSMSKHVFGHVIPAKGKDVA